MMATYQIFYWRYIPLSIRATDADGTVSQALSARFEGALKTASENYKSVLHSSEFQWSEEQERAGTAAEVAATIVQELEETWDEDEAFRLYHTSG